MPRPVIGAIRAADLTADQLHDELVSAYAAHLRMPELTVTPRSYGSRQVFVGGEVARLAAPAGGQAQPVMVATHNRLLGSYEGAAGGKTGSVKPTRRGQ